MNSFVDTCKQSHFWALPFELRLCTFITTFCSACGLVFVSYCSLGLGPNGVGLFVCQRLGRSVIWVLEICMLVLNAKYVCWVFVFCTPPLELWWLYFDIWDSARRLEWCNDRWYLLCQYFSFLEANPLSMYDVSLWISNLISDIAHDPSQIDSNVSSTLQSMILFSQTFIQTATAKLHVVVTYY